MKKRKPIKEKTITGYVISADWDLNGDVISICIETDNGEYMVEDNDLSQELFELLDEEVELTGIIKKGKDGTNWIKVMDYEPRDHEIYNEDNMDEEELS
ncbi:MAG: hypothetical protein ISS66_02100 [Desulfobacteraceae bacterium]|nr:hypothetical protein [Bacteroidota bacterium]MBL7174595.1 hypothetical protein [Desulfobacteraceae bacterium]